MDIPWRDMPMKETWKTKIMDKILYRRYKKKEKDATVKKIMNLPVDVYYPDENIQDIIDEKRKGD